MERVLLLNMPFASARYPSTALSLLKPILEQRGIGCDIYYANIEFYAFSRSPAFCEAASEIMIVGEQVFGEELFNEIRESKLPFTNVPLLSDEQRQRELRKGLSHLQKAAKPFLKHLLASIAWERYDLIGFTSVFSQQIASLALAKRIKERWPKKIIAFGGANCEEEMGETLLEMFPSSPWSFQGDAGGQENLNAYFAV